MQTVVIFVIITNNKTESMHMCGWVETPAWVTVPGRGQESREDHLCKEGKSFPESAPS